MKILYLTDDFPPDSFGGAGIVAFNLARYMADKGHEVYVITSTQTQDNQGFNFQNGIGVYRVYSKYHIRWRAYLSLYNPQTIKKISKIIYDLKPDVVHAHNIHLHLSYHSLKLAKKYCPRVILTAHDTLHFSYGKVINSSRHSFLKDLKEYGLRYNPFRIFFIRCYLKHVDVIVAVSDALSNALMNNGIPDVQTIYNGINLDEWKSKPEEVVEFKNKYKLGDKKIVLFAGRLTGLKGRDAVIKAMKNVADKFPDVVLLVVGDESSYGLAVKNSAAKFDFSNFVFSGWLDRDEIKNAYFASSVVVVPSIYLDPFPTVNLEAMAASKPVIGTMFGGTPEIVVNGETGYIVNPNDTPDFAKKIYTLLGNPEKAIKMGENGYERVSAIFNSDIQVNKYIEIYKS